MAVPNMRGIMTVLADGARSATLLAVYGTFVELTQLLDILSCTYKTTPPPVQTSKAWGAFAGSLLSPRGLLPLHRFDFQSDKAMEAAPRGVTHELFAFSAVCMSPA